MGMPEVMRTVVLFKHLRPLTRKPTLTAFRLQAVCQLFEWLGYPLARNINLFERFCHPFVANINPFQRLGDPFVKNINLFKRLPVR